MASKTKAKDISSFKVKNGDSIVIRQVRSDIGRPKDQRATLKTLGLGRIGHQTTQRVDASLCGKLRKIWHMVEVSQP
jgi:large subunit ribosomal protein L30